MDNLNKIKSELSSLNKHIFNKKFFWFLLVIFSLEFLSFFSFLFPATANIFFIIVSLAMLSLALKDLKYGLLIAFIELFISSKGYLFYFEQAGMTLSIRIAFWLILMSVWLAKYIVWLLKEGNGEKTVFNDIRLFFKTDLFLFSILFLLTLFGVANGVLHGNDFADVFFDFNSWLFVLLAFPVYYVYWGNKNFKFDILQIFIIGTFWVSLKTLFFEFFFSHPGFDISNVVYRWIRTSGVGEITVMDSGFVRIFFQSQIFILIAFFLVLFILNNFILRNGFEWFRSKDRISSGFLAWFSLLTLFISVIIISFSRSFWLGSFLSFFVYLLVVIKKYSWKNLLLSMAVLFVSFFLSILLLVSLIKFPYPEPGDIDIGGALESRVNSLDESAVSSRYNLWPKLITEIGNNLILGSGFGSTVTYESNDPRVREQTADGVYTTYAFEWGLLDIWLKLGLPGLVFLLYFFTVIIKRNFYANSWFNFSLSLGLIVLFVVSFFSPYINHPLGLGFLILASVFSRKDIV